MKPWLSVLLLLFFIPSCAPVDREKLTQEVLAKDPEFKTVLEKRHELAARIQTYERELAVRRSDAEKKITQLRKDLVDATASARTKTEEIKKRMEPDRQRLQEALAQATNNLRVKREQRASLGKQLAMLKKNQGKEQQAALLVKQAQALDAEMSALKEQIRLIKIKLLLIKL